MRRFLLGGGVEASTHNACATCVARCLTINPHRCRIVFVCLCPSGAEREGELGHGSEFWVEKEDRYMVDERVAVYVQIVNRL